jgi:hypothetical protein
MENTSPHTSEIFGKIAALSRHVNFARNLLYKSGCFNVVQDSVNNSTLSNNYLIDVEPSRSVGYEKIHAVYLHKYTQSICINALSLFA